MRCSPLSECVLAGEAGGRAPGLRTGFGRRDKADRGALRPGLSFFCGKRNYSFLARNQTGRQWRTTIYRGGSDLFLSWRVSGLMAQRKRGGNVFRRSEEHTSEVQSLMRTTYAVFFLSENIIETFIIHDYHIN